MGSLGVSITRHCSVGVELDPLCRVVKVGTDWDVEVRDVASIGSVPCRRCVEGLLIVAYPLFHLLDMLGELKVCNCCVGLPLRNGGEESIGDCLWHVLVGAEGIGHCAE